VNWIADCIAAIRAGGHRTIEAEVEAEDAWVEHVNAVADLTLYKSCNSWYLGANVPGKPRIFMPLLGVPDYVARCKEIAATGYPGFVLAGGG
jgi:cyclohexanone monooxygenase